MMKQAEEVDDDDGEEEVEPVLLDVDVDLADNVSGLLVVETCPSPIIYSFPAPQFKKDRFPVYRYNAPSQRDSVITFETMDNHYSLLHKEETLESEGIIASSCQYRYDEMLFNLDSD